MRHGIYDRRDFLKKAASATFALTIIPRHVLGGNGFLAANDRINLGYIGVGKQAIGLLEDIGRCKETTVLAACDVDQKKLGKFHQFPLFLSFLSQRNHPGSMQSHNQ